VHKSGPFGLEIKQVVLATAGVSVLAVILTLSLNWPERSADTVSVESSPLRNEWAAANLLEPADDFSAELELEWVPYRARETRWDERRVGEHWMEPATVGRELLDQQIKARIDGILKEVP
jgi:hypothetical protein